MSKPSEGTQSAIAINAAIDVRGPVAVLVQPKLPRVKFYEGTPGKSYMPSNGTEGEFFMAAWCEECARDKAMNGTVHREGRNETDDDWCEILGRSFREDAIPEWIYGEDGQPKCTQFVPMGEPIPTPRCLNTPDLFASVEVKELRGEEAAEAISDFAGLALVPLDEDEQRRRASPTFQESQRHTLRAELKGTK